ncbi:hypothetical protein AA313_de0204877 [Arthrobotrys entomopaga]|nr:hypothetical protein AA313_de0204877 [Arthrobotrys entomopaga]
MAPKPSFTSTSNGSPSKSRSYRIRWHNSGAEDYNPPLDGSFSLKRNATTAMLETNIGYQPDQLLNEHDVSVVPSNAQKKRKPSTSTSIASSPIKLRQSSEGTCDIVQPEPNPPAKKRRGRPPKTYPPVTHNPSKIEFVHETGLDLGTGSQVPLRPHSSPVLQPLDTFVGYGNSSLHAVNIEPLAEADFQANKYWDASFAGSMMENTHMANALSTMASDVDLVAATATFDWSVLPTSMVNNTTHSVMDPLRPMSMHSLGESFFHDVSHPDTFNFSFAQDPMSASDIISPVSVNPNLIFAGEPLEQSFCGDLEGFRPYHQQNLQQQQEQQGGQRKRQTKTAPPKGQTQTVLKPAASKPVMKRALTESALIKTVGMSKSSNATVRPSPAKKMSSFSGKAKPLIRDENTTPSPTIDSVSVRHLSPRSSETKRSARKTKTAVNFSISPGGRAKAEKVIVQDANLESDHSDSDGGRGEYESDSSTDEDDFDPLSSYSMAAQRLANSKGRRYDSSLAMSRSMERPKLARFKTAPANSFSSSSRYLVSGDFTSDSFGAQGNPFLPPDLSMSSFHRSPRKRGSKGSRNHSRNSSYYSIKSSNGFPHQTTLGSMREEDEYSEAETVMDEPTDNSPGDAILALKQAVARRNSTCGPGNFKQCSLSETPQLDE